MRGGSNSSPLSSWEPLLQDRNDRQVWQAISWNGSLSDGVQTNSKPSDEEFQLYYDNLMKVTLHL